ncbi:TetR/AcrR family transcriptional regulator [Streptomyces iconiensis]|uniref:TetR/AcrR family transcriptional regulator n=1 Tax=Streptomyces iconiensis TaxID=1384038 RepID=A0ABT6ZQD7_9ACTN|nr:TetR/AcrR family transcriptional regulator [Streptomyces iconiensis]MDJ1131265.1 TetR/AcrR family transcriptional regulator [Streptomyces iconiensis]
MDRKHGRPADERETAGETGPDGPDRTGDGPDGKTGTDGPQAAGRRAGGGGGGGANGGGGATRRRGPALENAILDAAWNVLVEHGYPGFTYEAIAARARTSRPVLYRRWPRREDLLMATLTKFWQPITVPETGSLRGDAIGFLRNAYAGRTHMITMMSVQLADYFRATGTSFSELRESLLPPGQPTAFEIVVARAVERGELPDVPRSSRVVNLPFDLLRHDMLVTRRSVSDEAIVEIVDEVWLPLLERQETPDARPPSSTPPRPTDAPRT